MATYEPVNSGHIEAMAYDADNEQMLVRFKSGDEYAYHGISFDTYESIKEAPSVGKALNACGVRGNKI